MLFSKNDNEKNKDKNKEINKDENKEENKGNKKGNNKYGNTKKRNFPEHVQEYFDDENNLLFIYDSKKITIGQNPAHPMEFFKKGRNGFPKEILLYEKLKTSKNDIDIKNINIKHFFKYDFEKNEYIKDLNEVEKLEEIKNLNDLKKLIELNDLNNFNNLKTSINEQLSQDNKNELIKQKLNKKEVDNNEKEEKIEEGIKDKKDVKEEIKDVKKEIKFNPENLLVKKPNVKYAIEVRNVSMAFKLFSEKLDNVKEYAIKRIRGQAKKQNFHALSNISFLIEKGDRLGIIGLNGAGKSTLLKIISGVMKPTEGKIIVRGKITPLLELGAGFDVNYTGRENIFLNGSILGFSREFLESKYEEIVEYSELGKFIEVPVKNYSSGMKAKLGFSISTILNPEILILDEVLSVGDVKFRKKANARITELFESGATIILVSHTISQIKSLCNKGLWLDEGKLKMFGEIKEVCDTYERIMGVKKKKKANKKAKPKKKDTPQITSKEAPIKNKETTEINKKEDSNESKQINKTKEKEETTPIENKEIKKEETIENKEIKKEEKVENTLKPEEIKKEETKTIENKEKIEEEKEEKHDTTLKSEEIKENNKSDEKIEDPGVIQLQKIEKTMKEIEEKIEELTTEEEINNSKRKSDN